MVFRSIRSTATSLFAQPTCFLYRTLTRMQDLGFRSLLTRMKTSVKSQKFASKRSLFIAKVIYLPTSAIDCFYHQLNVYCFSRVFVGENRLRVHKMCLPIASTVADVIQSADQQCIVGLLSKMGKIS